MISNRLLTGFILMALALAPLASQTTEIPVPLLYWGQKVGEVRIRVNPRTGNLQEVHREAWEVMKNSTYTPLESLLPLIQGEFLTTAQWRTLGWDFVLNPETVTLAVVLSEAAERPRIISLSREPGRRAGTSLEGAFWSGVLNGMGEVRLINYTGLPESGAVAWDSRLDFAGALKGGWSLRVSGEADSLRSPFWSLEEVQLRKDFPGEGLSLGLGSIPARGQSWVQTPGLWGFSFGTDFGLQPEKTIRSGGTHVIFLAEPSTLVVRQNGQITGRLSLPPGPLELKDIPLRQGINRVELEISGPGGETEIRVIELPFLSALLAPGVFEYTTSMGMERNYPENFLWSLQFRRGIMESLTLGSGIQGDADEVLWSGDASLASPVGSIRADVGLGLEALDFPLKPTKALSLQYDWQHASIVSFPRLSLGMQWKSDGFRNPGKNRILRPLESLGASGSINLPILGAAMATLIGRTQWTPSTSLWEHQVSGILSVHLGKAGIFTLRGTTERPSSGLSTWTTALNWSFFPDGTGFSSSIGQDLMGGSTLFQGAQSWEPDAFSQGVLTFGGAGNGFSGELKNGNAGLRYQSPWGESSLVHTSDRLASGEGYLHTTRLRSAAALATADGLVAFGRPVSGSFAVAEVLPEYRPFQPMLRSQTGGNSAPIMPWGTGILTNLQPYLPQKISPDSLPLPAGYHLGAESLSWVPERHQGARILLGSRRIITLESRLLDRSGSPVVLKAGTLATLDGKFSQSFFTNRLGAFQIFGLAPGPHVLTLVDGRSARFEVGNPESRVEKPEYIIVE